MLDEAGSECITEREEAENARCTFNFLPLSWRLLFLISAVTLICVWCANDIWEGGEWSKRLVPTIFLADLASEFGFAKAEGATDALTKLVEELDAQMIKAQQTFGCATNMNPGSTVFFAIDTGDNVL